MEQIDLREITRLEQSGVKASGEKTRQIGAEQEHHGEIKEPSQKIKEKCSEKIRGESDESSVDQSVESSVVQNDPEQGEYPIGEGRQTTAAKYTERWKIM